MTQTQVQAMPEQDDKLQNTSNKTHQSGMNWTENLASNQAKQPTTATP